MNARRALVAVAVAAVALAAPARAQDEAALSPATQTAADLQSRADDLLTKQKKFDEAAETYEKLLDHLDKKKNEFPDFPESQQKLVRVHAWYNLACARALGGHAEKALEAFEKAVGAGYYDWQWAEKDDDLASLRESPHFQELIQELKGTSSRDIEKLVRETVSAEPLFDFDFEVTTLDGKVVKLADLKGQTVIVDCFGTWCPPCREEIPHFVELANRAKAKGEPLTIVGLAWERADATPEVTKAVQAFATEKKINYAVAVLKQKDPILERIPNLQAFPTTLWIDAKGKVRGRIEGGLSLDELDAITRRVLDDGAEKKPAAPAKKPGEPEKRADEPF
jgi:thiol-disulfide isomerase/thioredoxin